MKRRAGSRAVGWLMACAAALAGCGGAGFPEVVDTRSLRPGGVPKIGRIRDLGTRSPPANGPLLGESDGVASPGELLLIEGSGFGKQPTVAIDERAAEVVARTAGGGIVARVPLAVRTGPRSVTIAVGDARISAPFSLRRIALVLRGDTLYSLAVDAGRSVSIGPPLVSADARAVRISPDGSCAYVVGGGKLQIIDLGAAGGPRVINALDLAFAATGLVVAERAPILFAVGDGEVQGFEIKDPRHPARYDEAALPAEAKGARKIEIDPQGRRLALLIPEGNRLALVDVSRPTAPQLIAVPSLLPEVRVPFVVDLRFQSDGETLWVLAGDNAASLAIGTQPTRLVAVRIASDPLAKAVTVQQSALLTDALAPLSLLVSRAPPSQAGTAIHLSPESAKIYFTGAEHELWTAGSPAAVAARFVAARFVDRSPAGIERATLDGKGAHAASTNYLLGAFDLAGGESAVAAAVAVTAVGRDFGVATVAIDGTGRASFIRLGPATDADLTPPFLLGDVRVQP